MIHTVESLMALADEYVRTHMKHDQSTLESALRAALRDEYNRGVEAAAKVSAPKYAAAPVVGVGKTYSGSIASCGCSTYVDSAGNTNAMQCAMHTILALKEPTP